jgi:biopolymer transport protein TolR
MSMDVGGSKGGIKADINVTPLVDVMLVLLIIMMLVAPLLNQGTPVKLPLADNTQPKPSTKDQTVVAIGADRVLYLNARPVAKSELATKVTEALEDKKEKIVLIKADTDVNYGTVMEAMDELRAAGIEDVGLITDPKTQQQSGAAGGR